MDINEFKKELSRLTKIDMFNPRFRELFNRYFPDAKDAEAERLEEVLPDAEEVKDKVEDIDKAEDEREIDKIEEDKAEDVETKEEKAEEVSEESKEIGKEVDELKEDKAEDKEEEDDQEDELFDARLELALVKGGVREDKLESAKNYIKYMLKDTKDVEKAKDILKDYPEWVRNDNPVPHKFGMAVGENGDNLTEEEKRLKAMGINPRD